MDNYALWQIRRQFRLKGIELLILMTLVLQADWRDEHWSWQGTVTGLHEDTGVTRRAIRSTAPDSGPGAIEVLEAKRLIVVERDFQGGLHGNGLLRIPIYEWVVVVHPSQVRSRESARIPDGLFAPDARPTRALFAPGSRPTRALFAPGSRPTRALFAPGSRENARKPCLESDQRGKRQRGKEGEGTTEDFEASEEFLHGLRIDPDDEAFDPAELSEFVLDGACPMDDAPPPDDEPAWLAWDSGE